MSGVGPEARLDSNFCSGAGRPAGRAFLVRVCAALDPIDPATLAAFAGAENLTLAYLQGLWQDIRSVKAEARITTTDAAERLGLGRSQAKAMLEAWSSVGRCTGWGRRSRSP